MKALLKKEPGKGFTLENVEEPVIKNSDDVKIKILRTSICGTDVHIYEWNKWAEERIKTPQIGGHEFVGEVIEIGDNVKGLVPGDIVASETHIPCKVCYQCKTGNMHVCKDMQILGVDRDGVFAEYAVVPEIVLWKLDESIPLKYASVMEPLGNAIHTATATDLRAKHVLITGAGPIGAMAIQVAKASGAATIIVSEVSEYRINMAKEVGADLVINPSKENLYEKVMEFTGNHGADVLLEMSGNVTALNDGIKSVRNAGFVSILGVYNEEKIPFVMNTAVFKNLTIQAITGRKMFETWHIATQWLKYNRINIDKIVTHEIKMEDFEKGFELMMSGKSGKIVMKVSE
ncbi:L-threonine 3-dehydrogenase [Oceanotoga teriensis]|uniref:L-threonine 3-dehydrogenase n=1 Tax=Oceanotoga teriensis TaxID=515440 RepID=A0AA45C8R5_9BACT|nr:L-threonine 3-dehydrogenase [Oceanotoga teriensis]PWJ96295.1 L-threonine 3-dehydrogenase [Oceanotoga teriensis]